MPSKIEADQTKSQRVSYQLLVSVTMVNTRNNLIIQRSKKNYNILIFGKIQKLHYLEC